MSTSRQASDAWFMGTERQERELAQRAAARRRVVADASVAARRANCGKWIARHLPDLCSEKHGPCALAIGAALEIKRLTGRQPTPDEVRKFRELWIDQGSRVARGWLLHTTGIDVSDQRGFVAWDQPGDAA